MRSITLNDAERDIVEQGSVPSLVCCVPLFKKCNQGGKSQNGLVKYPALVDRKKVNLKRDIRKREINTKR